MAFRWNGETSDSQIKMLFKIIKREGLGDVLADGSAAAAEKIGKGAEKYISHVKGGDLDAVDLRSSIGCALAEAVSSRGADPQRGWPSAEMLGCRQRLPKKNSGPKRPRMRMPMREKGQL